jgi:hypothetical protein
MPLAFTIKADRWPYSNEPCYPTKSAVRTCWQPRSLSHLQHPTTWLASQVVVTMQMEHVPYAALVHVHRSTSRVI